MNIYRSLACGSIIKRPEIECMQCGQVHDESGLRALESRCHVFDATYRVSPEAVREFQRMTQKAS
jgi:hypothetical protein